MRANKKILLVILIAAVVTAAICYLFIYKQIPQISTHDSPGVNHVIQPKGYVQLLFVGDLMFDRGARYYAKKNGSNEFIFDKVSSTLLSNDLVIANLEGPITDEKSIPKNADNCMFTFDPSLAKTLFQENIRLVDLGNNHISNFGREGVTSTKKYLIDANVDYFGAPNGEISIIKDINGVKIALVSYNEFSNNSVDLEQKLAIEEIGKVKPGADLVVVFTHWGAEYKLVSSNDMQKLAHQFVDAGADLVIGSHPHVIEQMEIYNGKRIYYSLGNFIFDMYFNEDVRNGLGVGVKIDKATKELGFSEKHFYLDKSGQTILGE